MDHEHINKQLAAIKATLEGAGYAVTSLIHDMETASPRTPLNAGFFHGLRRGL